MAELKSCPFCGGTKLKVDSKKGNNFRYVNGKREDFHVVTVRCNKCHTRGPTTSVYLAWGQYNAAKVMNDAAIEAWNRRTTVETNIYDKAETYPNCTVQVLTNTATGETSVGWWENGGKEDG